jgi:glycerol-3-phosphate dehydrogenase subunit C
VGLLDHIKPQATRNVDLLHEITGSGAHIVTSSPSCGMALRHEYPAILKTEKSREIAGKILDIHEFLVDLLGSGSLDARFDKMELTIAVHQPCHARAMRIGDYPSRLLELIPGIKVHHLEPRCCGIAGTFGMKKKGHNLSNKIGQKLFREINNVNPDLVATACGTCRIQIESATGIDTVYPISLLAEAYGLMPANFGILKNLKV